MFTEAPLSKPHIGQASDGQAFWVQTSDRIRIRVGVWTGKPAQHGTVLIFPGRSEYLERFGRTISSMVNSGYSVVSLDWRGHGLSDRVAEDSKVCHVQRFTDYQNDVAALVDFAEAQALPKPWYLFGNSMGCCIGLRALSNGLSVSAVAFTAPLWDIKMSTPARLLATPISTLAQAIGRSQSYVPGYDSESYVLKTPFSGNKVTHDKETYDFLISLAEQLPELEIGGPTMGWLHQCLKECKSLSTMRSPDLPCLVFCGDQDNVVDIKAIEQRMQNWPRGRFEQLQGAKHELVMEIPSIRDSVLGDTVAFYRDATAII